MTRPIIFLGPSLRPRDARDLLDATYRPPAGQGDLLRAAQERPPAIGLIDGIFKDAPTVRHREILWAMAHGVPVFGASSMGALRAAELAPQGMIGVGLIYRWFRRFPLLPDDAVAVTHGPAELGSPALSDAMVDIRRSFSAARRHGALTQSEERAQVARIASQPFPDRNLPSRLDQYRISQKAADARALLQIMAQHAADNTWPVPKTQAPPIVHAWLDDLRDSGLVV